LRWLQYLEYPICFIHMAYFHFILSFSDNVRKYRKLLIFGYLFSVLLVLINSQNGFFDSSYLRNKDPFLFWPHASPLLTLFIGAELFYVSFGFYVLAQSIRKAEGTSKSQLRQFLIVNVIGWTGGAMNWFHFYDSTPIPPIGNPAVTFYLLAVFYLIFKHDIFDMHLVIQKTFVYATLTLFITLIYTLFVIVSERLFQSYFGYSSVIATAFAALTIALLFNPLRNLLIKVVDKTFFGKNIAELSAENVRMKAELQKQDRMKAIATLASGMAHEIKNPLTSIKTFAEYLPEKYDDPEFRSKFQKIVVDEVDRVNNIVRQLLDFSKPQELSLKPDTITPILEDTLGLLNNNLLKNKIGVVKNYGANPTLSIDKNQLKQAFLNIFLNSIQAMPNGGVLTVSTSLTTDYRLLTTIQDTGLGIPEDQIQHVFDPFYTTKEDGTGLGLSIVHGIITKHGGRINIGSEAGKGTTINVFLKSRS